jgi:hypothetical protein
MGLGPLILSWLAAVPGSVASGALLGAPVSAGSKAGAFIFMFLTSIFISMDIGGRAGAPGWKIGLLAVFLTVAAYTPWAATINIKDPKNKSRAAALPLSGLLYAAVLMIASGVMYGGEVSKMAGLQGAVITLMYVFISSSLGYQAVRAKKDPVARGQTIYMAGLLLLITLFDVLGAKNADATSVASAEKKAAEEVVQNRSNAFAARLAAGAEEANAKKGERALRNISGAYEEARKAFEKSPAGLAAFDSATASGAGLVNAKKAAAAAATA